MGKVSMTITLDKTLLKQAKKKYPRKLSAKIEELLSQELDEELQLARIENEKKQAQKTIERCDKLIKSYKEKKQENKPNPVIMTEAFKEAINEAVKICIESEKRLEYLKPEILKVQAKRAGITQQELLQKIEENKAENKQDKESVEPDKVQSLS